MGPFLGQVVPIWHEHAKPQAETVGSSRPLADACRGGNSPREPAAIPSRRRLGVLLTDGTSPFSVLPVTGPTSTGCRR